MREERGEGVEGPGAAAGATLDLVAVDFKEADGMMNVGLGHTVRQAALSKQPEIKAL